MQLSASAPAFGTLPALRPASSSSNVLALDRPSIRHTWNEGMGLGLRPNSNALFRRQGTGLAHSSSEKVMWSQGWASGGELMMAGNSGSSRAPSRSQSRATPSLLSGVSSSADRHNAKQRRCDVLANQSAGGDGAPGSPSFGSSGLMSRAKTHKNEADEVDHESFIKLSEHMFLTIADLKKAHDSFDARGSTLGGPGSPGAASRGSIKGAMSAMSQEDMERQADRLEAYKMVRKVEPELPPLSPVPTSMRVGPAAGEINQQIMFRNAGPHALQLSSPRSREEKAVSRKDELATRSFTATSVREEQLSAQSEQFSDALARKRKQGEQARKNRKGGQKQVKGVDAQKWFTVHVMASFAGQLHSELQMSRMAPEVANEYVASPKAQGLMGTMKWKKASVFVKQGLRIGAGAAFITQDEQTSLRLGLLVAMFRAKMRIAEKRREAKAIHTCITSWQVSGRCFMAFRRFAQRIVMLQRWWRITSKRLREVRDRVSRRWERLERAELTRELNKAAPLPKRGGVAQIPLLPLEERIQLEKVSEVVRLRFIEHELRTRRYLLLPQISLWEEEVAKWRDEVSDHSEFRTAHRALGQEPPPTTEKMFRWPPVRPSYLPKAHPQSEGPPPLGRGLACVDCCLGRQGDEELISMWRSARRNPNGGGWTEIPTPGWQRQKPAQDSGGGGEGNERRSGRGNEKPEQSSRLFGEEANKGDLTKWGIDPDNMPGLRCGGNEGIKGGIAPELPL